MKPKILITIGDFNSIAPEIIIKALLVKSVLIDNEITIITPAGVLEFYAELLKLEIKGPFDMLLMEEDVEPEPGVISEKAGNIAGKAIESAVKLCMEKEYDAVVTAPISKKALNIGGYNYDGHTEMLTMLSKSKDSVMFMFSKNIKIAFATTHPPLKEAARLITPKLLESKLTICYHSLKNDFKISKPKIAILGLNPHAGESGQIGNEEIKIIEPAMNNIAAKFKDAVLEGPFPADGYFGTKKYESYDMTFALYHDQGFIPFKMLAGFQGVNCTMGLPFVRTSPDHGTAFDIAGNGLADPASMITAIKVAGYIHKNRNRI